MENEVLKADIQLIDGKVKFEGTVRGGLAPLTIDYRPPFGSGEGYTSLELLLFSFLSCVSTTVIALIRNKSHKTVSNFFAKATGILRDTHPKAITHIDAMLTIISPDVEEAEVRRALQASEEKVCPVWAMLKGNVTTDVGYTILRK